MKSARSFIVVAAMAALTILLLAPALVLGADATVRWTHPTARENGVSLALSEIRETQVDYGICAAGGAFPAAAAGTQVVPAPATSVVITNLGYGTWCFRGRTADTGGLVSANSSVAQKVILAPPQPPVLSATITVAYDMKGVRGDGTILLGREVGTVAIGAPCIDYAFETNKGTFHGIDRSNVKLSREPRSSMIVTKCAIG